LTLREVDAEKEATPISDEEARKRFRELAWKHPDFNFSILEALMDHLEISEEQQREIIAEGARKWQRV